MPSSGFAGRPPTIWRRRAGTKTRSRSNDIRLGRLHQERRAEHDGGDSVLAEAGSRCTAVALLRVPTIRSCHLLGQTRPTPTKRLMLSYRVVSYASTGDKNEPDNREQPRSAGCRGGNRHSRTPSKNQRIASCSMYSVGVPHRQFRQCRARSAPLFRSWSVLIRWRHRRPSERFQPNSHPALVPVTTPPRKRGSVRSLPHARGCGSGSGRGRPCTAGRASSRKAPSASNASSPARWFV